MFNEDVELSENALTVLKKRYLIKDEGGNVVETPNGMFARVASLLSMGEKRFGGTYEEWYAKYYNLMRSLVFIPNTPTLVNAGRKLGQLSACFVLPVPDSMEEIFESVKDTALIHKSGGGTGFSFSRLRPKDSFIASTSGKASGPISFMKVFNAATEVIKQGGVRRGANMAMLSIDHPDIEEFIDMKLDLTQMTNFNVSVALTEEFMRAVRADVKFTLKDPETKEPVKSISAKYLFDKIVHNAWLSGEPGIIFIDRINMSRSNPTPLYGPIEATNPCGEQPLGPYEACNLGSINLAKFVINFEPSEFTPYISPDNIDWGMLKEAVILSTRALENIVEMNKYPIPEIDKMTRSNRRIGLGVMGWADMLFKLRVGYNTPEAVDLAVKIMSFIQYHAEQTSGTLAKERGVFDNWNYSIYGYEGQDYPHSQGVTERRNATVTTIAPTGSISIIANASGGIEPIFSLAYERNILDGTKMFEVNPYFKEVLVSVDFNQNEIDTIIAYAAANRSIQNCPLLLPADYDWIKKTFVTSQDISPSDHVKMQAAFQIYTENAVSKTVNFPEEATEDDIRDVYWLAYEQGLKGITVYRDNSRAEQPMSDIKIKTDTISIPLDIYPAYTTPVSLPSDEVSGWMGMMNTPMGKVRVWVTDINGRAYETYIFIAKSGSDVQAFTEALGRMISLSLRSGANIEEVINQLVDIGGSKSSGFGINRISSVADAVSKILKRHYVDNVEDMEEIKPIIPIDRDRLVQTKPNQRVLTIVDFCPECGNATLIRTEGCKKCPCGYSEC